VLISQKQCTINISNIYLLFIPFFRKLTYRLDRSIFTLDGSNDVDSHKDVPFGGFFDIAPHFEGEIL